MAHTPRHLQTTHILATGPHTPIHPVHTLNPAVGLSQCGAGEVLWHSSCQDLSSTHTASTHASTLPWLVKDTMHGAMALQEGSQGGSCCCAGRSHLTPLLGQVSAIPGTALLGFEECVPG